MFSGGARVFCRPGANVCVAAPSQGWGVRRGGGVPSPLPRNFFGYFNVEIPYFPGILVLTVKSQRATFGILGRGAWPEAPLPPPLNPPMSRTTSLLEIALY